MNKIKILMARNFTLEPLIDEIQEKLQKKDSTTSIGITIQIISRGTSLKYF